MESLKERILQDGKALSETVLKVDSFLNHLKSIIRSME